MLFINQAIASEVVENISANPSLQQPASSGFIPILLIFVIFYFLLIRPQQKKAKEHKVMVNALAKGDSVLTSGGIVGKITKVKDDGFVDLQIAKDTIIQVVRSTISSKVDKDLSSTSSEGDKKVKKIKKAKVEKKIKKA
ncbi:MAG: preprotein translocase subunit YajC [Rickettsiales bacterium]|jgi:preprotein translocase subunit YajC|nr:preprotein translocase subunit YajC [Rickettsiales bacterium]